MKKISLFFSTMFFSGLIPGPAGTWGSVVYYAIAAWIIKILIGKPALAIWGYWLIAITFIIGMLVIPLSIKELQKIRHNDKKASSGDYNAINIDEAHGMSIACSPVFIFDLPDFTTSLGFLCASFALFRIFDITKMLFISVFEKKMSSLSENAIWRSLIIMLDDTIAGIYAGTITWIFIETWLFSHQA